MVRKQRFWVYIKKWKYCKQNLQNKGVEPIRKSMVKKINLMEDLFGLANGAANQKLVYLLPYVGGFISASKFFLVAGHDFEFQRVISYNFFLYLGFRSRLSFHRKVRKKRDVSLFFFTTSTCSQILRY